MHCDFITVEGEKISKSIGNTFSLADLNERGFSAMDYKMWVLSGHYQGTRNFTFDSLEGAKARRLNWRNQIAECYQNKVAETNFDYTTILGAINNNLGSPEAFALIDEAKLSLDDWKKVDELFGLRLIADSPNISDEIRELIDERQLARDKRDFGKSDDFRDLLASKGITVKDTADGPVWQYI